MAAVLTIAAVVVAVFAVFGSLWIVNYCRAPRHLHTALEERLNRVDLREWYRQFGNGPVTLKEVEKPSFAEVLPEVLEGALYRDGFTLELSGHLRRQRRVRFGSISET